MQATTQERAVVAADMLMRFLKGPHRITLRVYGVFKGDTLLSWSCSRSYAERYAANEWRPLRVQYIGRVGP